MRQLCSLAYSTTCNHAFKWSSIPASITGAAQHQHPKKSSLQPKHETLNSKAHAPVMLAGILDHLHASITTTRNLQRAFREPSENLQKTSKEPREDLQRIKLAIATQRALTAWIATPKPGSPSAAFRGTTFGNALFLNER